MQERLQKIIARAGLTSRRKAEELILQGRVTVNGRVVTELGSRADAARDRIKVDQHPLRAEESAYVILHKPRGVLSAVSDEHGRPVVTDLVKSKLRLYPAGRLDFESEGLILLTNDGDLARAVMESGKLEKLYLAKVSGEVSAAGLARLRKGAVMPDGERFAPCRVELARPGNNCWYEVGLKQGRNRQVRRMFEVLGHRVMRLRRLAIGPIGLAGLKVGEWRELFPAEIHRLRLAAGADPEGSSSPRKRRRQRR